MFKNETKRYLCDSPTGKRVAWWKKTLGLSLAAYLAVTFSYDVKRLHEANSLTGERKYLQQEHNVTFLLTDDQLPPKDYIDIIERQEIDKPLTVNQIPQSWIKKPLLWQLKKLFKKNISGVSYPFAHRVATESNCSRLLIHELAHRKGYEATEDFWKQWVAVSGEENYQSIGLRYLDYAFPSSQPLDTCIWQKGFVNNYATTNEHEDLCETVESFSMSLRRQNIGFLDKLLHDNSATTKKIRLATELGAIHPQDTIYAQFLIRAQEYYGNKRRIPEVVEEFDVLVSGWMQEHPGNRNTLEVLLHQYQMHLHTSYKVEIDDSADRHRKREHSSLALLLRANNYVKTQGEARSILQTLIKNKPKYAIDCANRERYKTWRREAKEFSFMSVPDMQRYVEREANTLQAIMHR